LQSLKKEERKG